MSNKLHDKMIGDLSNEIISHSILLDAEIMRKVWERSFCCLMATPSHWGYHGQAIALQRIEAGNDLFQTFRLSASAGSIVWIIDFVRDRRSFCREFIAHVFLGDREWFFD